MAKRALLAGLFSLLVFYLLITSSAMSPIMLTIKLDGAEAGKYVLYLDSGAGFSEQETSTERIRGGAGAVILRYRLPVDDLERIRFDPATVRQALTLRSVCLDAPFFRQCVRGDELFASLRPLSDIRSIDRTGGDGVTIVTNEGDPYVLFGPEITRNQVRISRWLTPLSGLIAICLGILLFLHLQRLQASSPALSGGVYRWAEANPWSAVTLACLVIGFGLFYSADKQYRDTAYFGGDTWEYQSLAVNWAKGHGLTFGAIEDYETYKFDQNSTEIAEYKEFVKQGKRGGHYNRLRTPGYPLFLGAIYRGYRVSPLAAKHVQLFLIVVACASLPLFGYAFWGKIGVYSGIGASLVSFPLLEPVAGRLMTESLIIFSITCFLGFFLIWKQRISRWTTILFGVVIGACLLVKGSMIFLPLLFIPFCISIMRKTGVKRWRSYAAYMVFAAMFVVGVWSVNVSYQTGELVILSKQSKSVLLDGNNEYSIKDGAGWRPAWRGDTNSFYKRDDVRSLPAPIQVLMFLREHIRDVPGMLSDKLRIGFGVNYVHAVILLFILECWLVMRNRIYRENKADTERAILTIGLGLLLWYGLPVVGHYALLAAPFLYILTRKHNPDYKFVIPIPLMLIFLNFVLLTLVLFGDRRFTLVIDHFVLLVLFSCVLVGVHRIAAKSRGSRHANAQV